MRGCLSVSTAPYQESANGGSWTLNTLLPEPLFDIFGDELVVMLKTEKNSAITITTVETMFGRVDTFLTLPDATEITYPDTAITENSPRNTTRSSCDPSVVNVFCARNCIVCGKFRDASGVK